MPFPGPFHKTMHTTPDRLLACRLGGVKDSALFFFFDASHLGTVVASVHNSALFLIDIASSHTV
jgi:hypothetical protein